MIPYWIGRGFASSFFEWKLVKLNSTMAGILAEHHKKSRNKSGIIIILLLFKNSVCYSVSYDIFHILLFPGNNQEV